MVKSIFKKILILALALIIIFLFGEIYFVIRNKLMGIDVRIKFEATNTAVKVTSVMYGNDKINFRDENIKYSDNTLRLKKKGRGTEGCNYYKIRVEAYGKKSEFYIGFNRTNNLEHDMVWSQNMVIEIEDSNNEKLTIVAKENDNCEGFRNEIENGNTWIYVLEVLPAIH